MDDIRKIPLPIEDQKEKQRGRPFEPGQSGNLKGRPKGSRNQATLFKEALLEEDAEAIIRKLVEKAKAGDPAALRLCIERLLPPRRDRPVMFELGEINSAEDAAKESSRVLSACADGTLAPDEATTVMGLITSHTNVLEVTKLEAELRELEKKNISDEE